jgi:large subunit ribosomal protein L6
MPVDIPEKVEITVDENNLVTVKGPKGEISETYDMDMAITIEENQLIVKRPTEQKRHKALHGLTRAKIQNMVTGVTEGFEKKLQIVGVGYRAAKNGNKLDLSLGFSHPVVMEDPEGITTECPSQTEIVVKGIDRQKVGNYAAKIRDWRRPEPYKGKGIRYVDEYVRRKEGKTGK